MTTVTPSSFSNFITIALLLSLCACNLRGTYIDAADPTSAKLRFVSYAENSTLDYYDAEHCEGKTTGLLNNWITTDSFRRVGMSTLAPLRAAYLEIKIPAEKDLFLLLNSLDIYGVSCAITLPLRGEISEEYELTLNRSGSFCTVAVERLADHSKQTFRAREHSFVPRKFPPCTGKTAFFTE